RVVVLEDGIKHGGIASTLSELFRENGLDLQIHSIGVPLEFIQHSKRAEILQDIGITSQSISRQLVGWASLNVKQEGMQLAADENADRKRLH
ncbi:MAG: 1-deoxy-D-xylulose-5-phosphate synthase, partial [Actinobacteria bacterium]|nr:1-deoxy-D-xylulose-5-phosphate synthase [Actinomycetota bacterium]